MLLTFTLEEISEILAEEEDNDVKNWCNDNSFRCWRDDWRWNPYDVTGDAYILDVPDSFELHTENKIEYDFDANSSEKHVSQSQKTLNINYPKVKRGNFVNMNQYGNSEL